MTAVRVVSDDGNVPLTPPVATGEVPGSLLDSLRRSSIKSQQGRTLDKAVPGFDGMLVLRFRPLDVGQLERFVESRRAGRVSELGESIDAMATCCIGVFGRDGDRLIDLNVGLDNRLAELLAWPVPPDAKLSTREVIIKLFGGEAFPLGAFVDDLAAWMSNPDGNGQPPGES